MKQSKTPGSNSSLRHGRRIQNKLFMKQNEKDNAARREKSSKFFEELRNDPILYGFSRATESN